MKKLCVLIALFSFLVMSLNVFANNPRQRVRENMKNIRDELQMIRGDLNQMYPQELRQINRKLRRALKELRRFNEPVDPVYTYAVSVRIGNESGLTPFRAENSVDFQRQCVRQYNYIHRRVRIVRFTFNNGPVRTIRSGHQGWRNSPQFCRAITNKLNF